MTMLFLDGFDHYDDAQILSKWTGGGGSGFAYREILSPGRYGGNYLRLRTTSSVWLYKTVGSSTVLTIGFAWRCSALSQPANFIYTYSNTTEAGLRMDATGAIKAYVGGGLVATGTKLLNTGDWNHVEFQHYSHGASGTIKVKINGALDIDYTGDTLVNANPSTVYLYAPNNSQNDYDDFFILDDNGAVNNDFIGDHKIEAVLPGGAGNYSQWTPSAGSNYQNVDDNPPDEDSTYNSAPSSGLKDSYAMGDLTTLTGSISAVQVISRTRKDDAGPVELRNFVRQGGSDYAQTNVAQGDSYSVLSDILETDPDTGIAWTIAGVNSAEAGIERTT